MDEGSRIYLPRYNLPRHMATVIAMSARALRRQVMLQADGRRLVLIMWVSSTLAIVSR